MATTFKTRLFCNRSSFVTPELPPRQGRSQWIQLAKTLHSAMGLSNSGHFLRRTVRLINNLLHFICSAFSQIPTSMFSKRHFTSQCFIFNYGPFGFSKVQSLFYCFFTSSFVFVFRYCKEPSNEAIHHRTWWHSIGEGNTLGSKSLLAENDNYYTLT